MGKRYCITCGAPYGTAHATNCPAYVADKDARIAELEQQVEALKEAAVATCEGHRQKVAQGDLSYYQYPSEQMERLATLATAQQEGE